MTEGKNTIHFIMTGGTLDSFYDGSKDTVRPLEHSAVPSFIQGLKLYEKTEFTEVCMKDSRELTQEDREKLLKIIQDSPYTKIIITHGTYTMPDTARYLKANLKRDDQTIVLTASMIPLTGFTNSDGGFNLGYSMAKVQELPPGYYVCMNGRVFSPEEVVKLVSEGKFGSIFGEKQ